MLVKGAKDKIAAYLNRPIDAGRTASRRVLRVSDCSGKGDPRPCKEHALTSHVGNTPRVEPVCVR